MEKSDLIHIDSFVETMNNLAETPAISKEDWEKLLEIMQKQNTVIFVAISPEFWIIWTTTLLIEQKFLRWWKKAWHLEDIITRKWFEWKWIWSALIQKATEKAVQEQCYKVILDCDEELSWYYEKFWFKKNGIFMRKYL